MRRRELNTDERTWREDQRSRPTKHSKKGVKPPKAISVKHVAYALLFITITIEVAKCLAI